MCKRVCVIIPTYNNARTLRSVVEGVLRQTSSIIVVNDGSTDDTAHVLALCDPCISVVTHERNKGKGAALVSGFKEAVRQGFDYAITIDSDGQHFPSDLPLFLEAIRRHPDAIIVGNRFARSASDDSRAHMNPQSRFANRFSNFWFTLQTGVRLPDTQTGYRAYPLHRLRWLPLITSRYEAELELMVFATWNGVRLVSIPIQVYYPPQSERVSHFRPTTDFLRISLLNTFLCGLALVYALPRKLLKVVATVLVLLLLFVLMLFVQAGLLVFFLSHRATESQRLAYHGSIRRVSSWLLRHLPGVSTTLHNPTGEDFSKPGIIIANHQSHLDLLCIMMLTPRLVILTKRWVWNNPLYGVAIRYAEYMPVSNDFEENETQLVALLSRGYSVMIFPEGTRSASLSLLRFHQGAFYLAQKHGLDLIPVFLNGTGQVLNKQARTHSPGHITIEVKPRVSASSLPSHLSSVALAQHFRRQYQQWKDEYDAQISF